MPGDQRCPTLFAPLIGPAPSPQPARQERPTIILETLENESHLSRLL